MDILILLDQNSLILAIYEYVKSYNNIWFDISTWILKLQIIKLW